MQTYTLRDLLRARYDDLAQQLESELQPVGVMEVLAVSRIFRDQSRLVMFDTLPESENPNLDKARHQTGLNLRHGMKELRQLQADRFLKAQLDLHLPGAASVKDVHKFLKARKATPAKNQPAQLHPDAVAHVESKIAALLNREQELQFGNLKKRSQFDAPAKRGVADGAPLTARREPT